MQFRLLFNKFRYSTHRWSLNFSYLWRIQNAKILTLLLLVKNYLNFNTYVDSNQVKSFVAFSIFFWQMQNLTHAILNSANERWVRLQNSTDVILNLRVEFCKCTASSFAEFNGCNLRFACVKICISGNFNSNSFAPPASQDHT